MERPVGFAFASGVTDQGRIGSVALTAAIHVGAILALVAALNQRAVVNTLHMIEVAIDAPRELPSAPPPPPPALLKPTPPVAIIPEFTVQQSAAPPPSITTVPQAVTAPAPAPTRAAPPPAAIHAIPDTVLKSRMGTHTLPPYPPISVRLNEQGTTLMEVAIAPQGHVTDCRIVTSSSSERLDQAGCDFVKTHWRWDAPTVDGKPIAAKTRVSIQWDLRNAK